MKRYIDNKLLFEFEKYQTTLKSVHKKALNIVDNSGGAQYIYECLEQMSKIHGERQLYRLLLVAAPAYSSFSSYDYCYCPLVT